MAPVLREAPTLSGHPKAALALWLHIEETGPPCRTLCIHRTFIMWKRKPDLSKSRDPVLRDITVLSLCPEGTAEPELFGSISRGVLCPQPVSAAGAAAFSPFDCSTRRPCWHMLGAWKLGVTQMNPIPMSEFGLLEGGTCTKDWSGLRGKSSPPPATGEQGGRSGVRAASTPCPPL